MKHIITGKIGEELSLTYLKQKGYKILHKNYVNVLGEIDIIARKKNVVVFVEIKTRSSNKFGLPSESVTRQKQNKIKQVASLFLKQKGWLEKDCRFDVIEVLDRQINHIENAF